MNKKIVTMFLQCCGSLGNLITEHTLILSEYHLIIIDVGPKKTMETKLLY